MNKETIVGLLQNKVVQATTVIVTILSVLAAVWAVEDRYAKDTELLLVSSRLEQKIVDDQVYNLQKRIWMLEDRYGGPGVPAAPPEVKAEYRELKNELQKLKKKGN